MVPFDDATDDELVAIAARYPEEFSPKYADLWQEYFEALERRHLADGLDEVVETIDWNREQFSWLVAPFVSRLNRETLLDLLDRWSETVS